MFHIFLQNLVDDVSRETYILIFPKCTSKNVSRETTRYSFGQKSTSRN